MDNVRIVYSIIPLSLAVGAFAISYLQFREKGFLFNNVYIWASQEERRRMDENSESKKPHYRQSGFVFLLIGIIFLTLAAYIVTYWTWLYFIYWASTIVVVVYAIVSSVIIAKHNKA